MTEADETQVQDPPVTDAPEQKEPPAWDFGTPDPPAPQYVTVDQFNELKDLLTQRPKAQDYTDPLEQQLAAINELSYTDPVKAEKARLALVEHQIRAATDAVAAPLERESIVTSISKGLGPEAREYLHEHLAGYTASHLKGLAGDKKTMDLLRDAAENACRRRNGPGIQAPSSETASTVPTHRADAATERQLDQMYQQFKDAGVPGLPSREAFAAQMLEAN
jgi:hypothetical protein